MCPCCTYPSADTTPRRFDLDLPFPALRFGDLFKAQVFLAVETHGVHEFSGRHSVLQVSAVDFRALVTDSLAVLIRQSKSNTWRSTEDRRTRSSTYKYAIKKNSKELRLLTRCCRSPLLLASEPRMPCSLPNSHEQSCLDRMPRMGHAKVTCPLPRLAYYADGHVPMKRDAFNGRVVCGVSRGQGSCGVFGLAFGWILRDYFYGNGTGGVGVSW